MEKAVIFLLMLQKYQVNTKNSSNDNMKQTGLNGYVYDLWIDYRKISFDNILDICKRLINKNNTK